MGNLIARQISAAYERLLDAFLSVIPALAVLLTALVVGVIVGAVIRVAFAGLGRVFLRRTGTDGAVRRFLRAVGLRSEVDQLAGAVSFWGAIAVALVVGVSALEPGSLRKALDGVIDFLPRLLTAAFILLLGSGVAALARRGVLIFAVNAGIPWARGGAQGVRAIVLAFFVAAALEHLGLGPSILVAAFSIAAGGVVLALALAFGLGARDLARAWLEKKFREGAEDTGIRHV